MEENLPSKIIAGILSVTVGQLPSILVFFGVNASLYQPGIYRGLMPLLIIPLMVGIVSTWAIIRWSGAMWINLVIFLVLAAIVYAILQSFPAAHWIHPINWIMSYCAFSLVVAALVRLVFDLYAFWKNHF
jgi:hypothetical protein